MNFAMTAAMQVVATETATAVGVSAASAEHRKLTDAAQQFEGMMLQEMLKPMKEHGFCTGDAEDDRDDKDGGGGFADTLSSYGTEAMATAISKGGGLGIAKQVVARVESERSSHAGANKPSSIQIPK